MLRKLVKNSKAGSRHEPDAGAKKDTPPRSRKSSSKFQRDRSIRAEECPGWKFTKTPHAKDQFVFRDGDNNEEVIMKAGLAFQNYFSQVRAENSYWPSDADWDMPTMNGKLMAGDKDRDINSRNTTTSRSSSVQRKSTSFKSDYRFNSSERAKETTKIMQKMSESVKIGRGASNKDTYGYKYTGEIKNLGSIYPTRSVFFFFVFK